MSPIRMSRIESAVRIVLELIEAFNRHDLPALARLLGDRCVLESAGPVPAGTAYKGKEAVLRRFEEIFHRSPGASIEVEEIFGTANRCVTRWRYEEPETAGEEKKRRGVFIFQVSNGAVSEILSYVKEGCGSDPA